MPYQQTKDPNQAVLEASGRNWSQWHDEMHRKGFAELSHKEMSKRLREEYNVDSWWAKRIIQSFEDNFGISQDDHKNGFDVSVTKTFNYPAQSVFSSAVDWFDQEKRARCKRMNDGKSMVCEWLTDHSRVNLRVQNKEGGRTKLILQHENLESEVDAEVMRNFWKENIVQMVESL